MSSDSDRHLETGHTFWFCGLSSAGKSTLANALARDLRSRGVSVLSPDGDQVRSGLSQGLGFQDSDRTENLRRAAEVAKLVNASGLHTVGAFITPLESHRQLVTEIVGADNLSLISIDTPLEVCRKRDVKGLYAHAEAGEIENMAGLSSNFAPPHVADLAIKTAAEAITTSAAKILTYALARLGALSSATR
jgi:adenylylsulfate kinase